MSSRPSKREAAGVHPERSVTTKPKTKAKPKPKSKTVVRTCKGRTRQGNPCKKKPMRGRDFCNAHIENAKVGQPTKLTPDREETIIDTMRAGCYLHDAAVNAGIHVDTIYEWLKRGEQDRETGEETIYSTFSEAFARAGVRVKVRAVSMWQASFAENPAEIGKFLAARYPADFGRREVDVQVSGSIDTQVLEGKQAVDVPVEAREEILAILAREAGEPPDAEVVEEG